MHFLPKLIKSPNLIETHFTSTPFSFGQLLAFSYTTKKAKVIQYGSHLQEHSPETLILPKTLKMSQEFLDQHRVLKAPPSLYYIPGFITDNEEEYLLRQVYAAPKPKWTQLSKRRLQNWGGLPHPRGMIAEDLPHWLQTYCKKIAELGVFEDKVPNHVLVNEYTPGQGIMPHTDGPLYYPTVSTISLGSHTVLDFYNPITEDCTEGHEDNSENSTGWADRYVCSMLLEPRSLILVRDNMYTTFLHGIAEVNSDTLIDSVVNLDKCDHVKVGDRLERTTRVSLTIRYVPKLLKAKIFLGGKR